MQVSSAPKFNDEIPFKTNHNITFGEALNISCLTDQSPSAEKIQWFFTKNNSNVTRELSVDEALLNIRAVNDDHEGTYECIVQNKIGKAQRKFNVEVLPRGKFYN